MKSLTATLVFLWVISVIITIVLMKFDQEQVATMYEPRPPNWWIKPAALGLIMGVLIFGVIVLLMVRFHP